MNNASYDERCQQLGIEILDPTWIHNEKDAMRDYYKHSGITDASMIIKNAHLARVIYLDGEVIGIVHCAITHQNAAACYQASINLPGNERFINTFDYTTLEDHYFEVTNVTFKPNPSISKKDKQMIIHAAMLDVISTLSETRTSGKMPSNIIINQLTATPELREFIEASSYMVIRGVFFASMDRYVKKMLRSYSPDEKE